ncbi:hypothetical protein IMSAGC021_00114 [Muribaculaceae bacterium]|nr:hypothetical protein IMSAGC021_00114 [Muribaculaceae bacterium]
MIDFSCYAVHSKLGVKREGYVKHRCSGRKSQQFALGRKDHYLGSEKIEFKSVKKVYCTRCRIIENVFDCFEPDIKLTLLFMLADLVFPVSGKALLGNFVHAPAAYLHFDPVAVRPH